MCLRSVRLYIGTGRHNSTDQEGQLLVYFEVLISLSSSSVTTLRYLYSISDLKPPPMSHDTHFFAKSLNTKVTMASEPTITPPYNKATMTSDPMVTPSDATSITTPNVRTSPSDQASFASLPREIRDEIYRLALPHFETIWFSSGPLLPRPSSCEILSPLSSTPTYAKEACEVLLKQNQIGVDVENLPLMLGEDGTSFLCDLDPLISDVVSLNCIDVKIALYVVVIHIELVDFTAELAGRVSLLLECPALQWVDVIIDRGWGNSMLRHKIETLSCAFNALAKKHRRQLTFYIRCSILDSWGKPYEGFAGDLQQLETLVRDG